MILLESSDVLVINKPPGVSVHDAPGPGGSLLRTLRERGFDGLMPVHRLDKDASGVLVFARNPETAAKWTARWPSAVKTYRALCENAPHDDVGEGGKIDAPILENQTGKPDRLKRALAYFKKTHPNLPLPPVPEPKTSGVHIAGRESQTHYHVLAKFSIDKRLWSWLEVRPEQGRMHQIRVHLKHINCPLAVDPLYGNRAELKESDVVRGGSARVLLSRMPLHAAKLYLPATEHEPEFTIEAPLPDDLNAVYAFLMGHDPRATKLMDGAIH